MSVIDFRIIGMLIAAMVLLMSLVIYCSDKGSDPGGEIGINLVSKLGCKDFAAGALFVRGPVWNMDCIHYEYDDNGLTIVHENAGFNCCTDFSAGVQVSGDTITITEGEHGSYCHCLCLFDVEYEITNLPRGEYFLKIVELYTHEGDALLQDQIGLNDDSAGQFCVERTYYPWNLGGFPGGSLTAFSSCGGFESVGLMQTVPDDSNCIVYNYDDSTGTLDLQHRNAVFNCCVAELTADFVINAGEIIVTENEVLLHGGCDCVCPYDLNMEVINLTPGSYTFKFTGPYLGDTVSFTADLRETPIGYYCFAESLPDL